LLNWLAVPKIHISSTDLVNSRELITRNFSDDTGKIRLIFAGIEGKLPLE
jgi:hypothetical protein